MHRCLLSLRFCSTPTLSCECLSPGGRPSLRTYTRCTSLSTGPSSPWHTRRAACGTFAAAPSENSLARSASTLCPSYPCQRCCKIICFWSQRGFCTETTGLEPRLPFHKASFRGSLWGTGCTPALSISQVTSRGTEPKLHLDTELVIKASLFLGLER